ncbi:MAG: stage II sporulation protein P [Bacilli bacterium]|nr:stage II sporulation protein P [Bacilli bacterium]
MKRVKLKKKKKISYKFLFLLLIFLITVLVTVKNMYKIDINNKEYLSFLIDESYKSNNNSSYIVRMILKLFSKIDVNKPETLLSFSSIKNKKSTNKYYKEEYKMEDNYDPKEYEDKTSYIQVKNNVENPILYIYNTHQLETYSDEGLKNGMVPNVMMAGSLLSEKLNKQGINTLFEDTNLYNFISEMGLPKDELYGGSRVFISNAKQKYSSLKYYIDLHRDSINKDLSTINIDNKNYARVLFVLGTTNSNYEKNKIMMAKLSDIINEKYPKLSRGIYEVDIPDWPEIYNQDMDDNAILIELGAKYNTMNEVINTVDVLSYAISKYIKENQ